MPEIYLKGNRHAISGEFNYARWPNVFYGIGGETSADRKEDITSKNSGAYFEYRRRLVSNLYPGIEFDYSRVEFTRIPAGGLLASGSVFGAKSGSVAGAGISFLFDDRDNILYPSRGYYFRVSTIFYDKSLKSDYDFERFSIDFRHFVKSGSRNVLALWFYSENAISDVPFWELPRLGDVIRGYNPMRFIDNSTLSFQAEYRLCPVWKRLGLVLFAGTGAVESRLRRIGIRDFKSAAGLGIRYLLQPSEKLNVRLDVGFGQNTKEIYFDIGEQF